MQVHHQIIKYMTRHRETISRIVSGHMCCDLFVAWYLLVMPQLGYVKLHEPRTGLARQYTLIFNDEVSAVIHLAYETSTIWDVNHDPHIVLY
jgi:hypothetical protein